MPDSPAPAAGASSAPARVILVHGLWMRPLSMHVLGRRLRQAGFRTEAFGYGSVREPVAACAERLAARLGEDSAASLVGHSLGGLIALRAASLRGDRVGRIVCLGTPLHGSPTADRVARLLGGARLLGQARAALAEGVCALGPCQVGMVAGDSPRGLGRVVRRFDGPHDGTVAVEETRDPALSGHCVVNASHAGLLFSREAAECCVAFLRHGRFDPGT